MWPFTISASIYWVFAATVLKGYFKAVAPWGQPHLDRATGQCLTTCQPSFWSVMQDVIRGFERMGARLEIRPVPRLGGDKTFDVNVRADRKWATSRDETFLIRVTTQAPPFQLLDVDVRNRHLVLYAGAQTRDHVAKRQIGAERFLCGHDERHWFVAAISEPVNRVEAAKRSLLPRALRDIGISNGDLNLRHTKHFKRQGEWFFVPVTDVQTLDRIGGSPIHRSEPIFRPGGGKRHLVSELVRFGGQEVVIYRNTEYTPGEWAHLVRENPTMAKARHERRTKDPEVYCRGKIRHGDHETLMLETWHRLYVNGEIRSGSVAFYD